MATVLLIDTASSYRRIAMGPGSLDHQSLAETAKQMAFEYVAQLKEIGMVDNQSERLIKTHLEEVAADQGDWRAIEVHRAALRDGFDLLLDAVSHDRERVIKVGKLIIDECLKRAATPGQSIWAMALELDQSATRDEIADDAAWNLRIEEEFREGGFPLTDMSLPKM